ncbi:MAG: sulfatase [Algibacter sp.]|uniref:sulfatase n=1 Tax=Algibacter sp. TaxID=1872428 RepID=UPI00260659D3|nr:sulfatase [Algibacter sp.]MDG1731256.1 sulfatase [Algibacter sp.]MDG2178803.1 sulfatase [Algibacter sp.]
MIVLDDLNDYVGVMGGHPQAKTPHIDKLAKEGVLFTNAHSNVPVCSPSRASFMTGILPSTSGNWGFGDWQKNEISMNSKSLPEHFRENGYSTYQTGKVFHRSKKGVWDEMGAVADYGPMAYNGKKAVQHPLCPTEMGVLGALDATFTSLKNVPNIPKTADAPGYNGWYNTNWKINAPFKYITDDNRDLMTDEKSVAWYKNKLADLENDNTSKPFFMAVGFIRPHTPLVVPQKYFDMFPLDSVKIPVLLENDKEDTKLDENTTNETRGRTAFRTLTTSSSYASKEKALQVYVQAYLASIAFADDMVGETLKALEVSSFKDNTMVMLFGDHGYNLGEKDYLFKYSLWEESTHVPLIIKHSNYSKNAGMTVDHPVSLVDVFPTLKDLCNLQGPTLINEKGAKLDGFSLKPFLENPEAKSWSGPDVALTIISSWKSKEPEDQHVSVRSKDFRYTLYANGSEELYNHKNDAYEWHNVADDKKHKKIKKDLKNQLLQQLSK